MLWGYHRWQTHVTSWLPPTSVGAIAVVHLPSCRFFCHTGSRCALSDARALPASQPMIAKIRTRCPWERYAAIGEYSIISVRKSKFGCLVSSLHLGQRALPLYHPTCGRFPAHLTELGSTASNLSRR
jgi:hypothetical protein